jgi:hypothetical protein
MRGCCCGNATPHNRIERLLKLFASVARRGEHPVRFKSILSAVGLVITLATPAVSHADQVTGKIQKFFVSTSNNAPFRVTMQSITLSQCGGNFLYVDYAEPTFQTYVSGLMTAYAQGKTVTLIYTVQTGGWCRVMEYEVN